MDSARDLTPEERGKLLQSDASFTEAHQELAVEGQTDANSDEPVNHHFIAFVNHNNELYELDGRKSYPVSHGPTSEDTFLQVNDPSLCNKLYPTKKKYFIRIYATKINKLIKNCDSFSIL